MLNPQKKPYVPKKGKPNVIMFVGLQVAIPTNINSIFDARGRFFAMIATCLCKGFSCLVELSGLVKLLGRARHLAFMSLLRFHDGTYAYCLSLGLTMSRLSGERKDNIVHQVRIALSAKIMENSVGLRRHIQV